jgi:hypothetical protein
MSCGYQEVECWERELKAAGWKPATFNGRRIANAYKSPSGDIYRGPFKAWTVMVADRLAPARSPAKGR